MAIQHDGREFTKYTATQDGLVTLRQLRSLGATEETVRWLVVDGQLERHRRGVYRLPGLPPSTWRNLRAALLAVPDAVAAGNAAGGLHRFPGIRPGAVEVVVPRVTAPRRKGVAGHSAPALESIDLTTVDGMPCTSIHRTICDLTPDVDSRLLDRMIDHVERLDRSSGLQHIRAAAERVGLMRRPALATLLAMLSARTPGLAGSGERTAQILRWLTDAHFRLPQLEHPVTWCGEDFVCDAAWVPEQVDLEIDDDWSHATAGGSQRDKRRDQLARRAGWEVVRVTPATTAAHLIDHLHWALSRAA